MSQSLSASIFQLLGAGGFGVVIGWYLYYVNRYRKAEVKLGDLVTVIGTLGGGAILALFPARTDLFGAYGIGLFVGFFGYFLVLILLVISQKTLISIGFFDGATLKKAPETFTTFLKKWRLRIYPPSKPVESSNKCLTAPL